MMNSHAVKLNPASRDQSKKLEPSSLNGSHLASSRQSYSVESEREMAAKNVGLSLALMGGATATALGGAFLSLNPKITTFSNNLIDFHQFFRNDPHMEPPLLTTLRDQARKIPGPTLRENALGFLSNSRVEKACRVVGGPIGIGIQGASILGAVGGLGVATVGLVSALSNAVHWALLSRPALEPQRDRGH